MSSIWPRRLATLSAAIATLAAGWLLLLHVRMVAALAPQEMREGAAVWLTRLLLERRNPYALTELPESTNVYGVLYHLVVYPLARIFGNSFQVHRFVAAVSIVGACVILFRLLRRLEVDSLFAWVGTLLFYVSSIYFVAPLARPDGLGIFLCVASLSCLMHDRVTPAMFSVGLACALLALATKVYLAYPPFVMATYFVIFGPRRRGLVWGLLTVAASIALLFALSTIFPTYINESLIANAQGGYTDFGHLTRQTRDWLYFSLPITVGLILLIVGAIRLRRVAPPTPFAFAAIANAGVFLGWLGWHPGAHMTYLFQLVTPALIPAIWPRLARNDWTRAAVTVSLPLALALNAHYFPMTFRRFSDAESTFAQINAKVAEHQRVLGSTEIAGLLALDGRPVVDSGQSEYFNVSGFGDSVPGLLGWKPLEQRWEQFVSGMEEDISRGRYDLIVRSRRNGLIPLDLVEDRYERVDTFEIDFAWAGQRWPVDLWEPRRVP